MNAADNKAVFLSYASQDAEAAKRICAALRAAGVEVWFDQSELRGGDAWDQSIRKQIKECALFLPVVSANTQARREGYFRLEWKLADDRTHLMANGTPFLVPVCVDDTKDWDALVPDSFMTVQWTRLTVQDPGPGDDAVAAFAERVKNLLSGEVAPVSDRHSRGALEVGAGHRPALLQKRGRLPWLALAMAGAVVVVTLALWQPWRKTRDLALPSPAVATAAPQTEAQKLIAQIWLIYGKQNDAMREDWMLAEELGERAVKLEPSNADAWAAYSQATLDTWFYGYDSSDAHFDQAVIRAERATSLAQASVEARFALANCYRMKETTRTEGERMLRELVQRVPSDKRILRTLAATLRMQKKSDEALVWLDRAAALPGGDPIALFGKFSVLRDAGRLAEAEAMLDKILALDSHPYANLWKVYFHLCVHDDLEQARTALGKIPASFLLRDESANLASLVWLWRREPDRCVAALNGLAQDFLSNRFAFGEGGSPRAFRTGQAHQVAGRNVAAQTDWQAALQKVEQRLKTESNEPDWLYWKARLLACLGERVEAERSLEVYRQLAGGGSWAKFSTALVLAPLGKLDEAVNLLGDVLHDKEADVVAQTNWRAMVRHDPSFDPLRGQPKFQALLAELRANPVVQEIKK